MWARPALPRHVPGSTKGGLQRAVHGFAARNALVHYASGAVFVFISKNACARLRASLAYANGCIADVKEWIWVHSTNGTFSASLADLACGPVTAVILRCPFRRLVSTFVDTRPFSGHVMADSLPPEGQEHTDAPLAEMTLQKSKGYLPRPADLFDTALIAKVRRLYAEDFRLYRALAGSEGLMFDTTDAGSKACP